MGNMSYCRFENTSKDLGDCIYALETLEKPLSDRELDYAKEIVSHCAQLLELLNENAIQAGLSELSEDYTSEVSTLHDTLDRMNEFAADLSDEND